MRFRDGPKSEASFSVAQWIRISRSVFMSTGPDLAQICRLLGIMVVLDIRAQRIYSLKLDNWIEMGGNRRAVLVVRPPGRDEGSSQGLKVELQLSFFSFLMDWYRHGRNSTHCLFDHASRAHVSY